MDAMQATKYVTVAMPVKVSATANDQKLYTKHGVIRDGWILFLKSSNHWGRGGGGRMFFNYLGRRVGGSP